MTVPAQSGARRQEPAGASTMLVVDASAVVDLLADTDLAGRVAARLRGRALHAPAHFGAEVVSALGRLHRDGALGAHAVSTALAELTSMPVTEHPVRVLTDGAWQRRGRLRLLDALYVELAARLGTTVVSTDLRLARAATGLVDAVGDPEA